MVKFPLAVVGQIEANVACNCITSKLTSVLMIAVKVVQNLICISMVKQLV